MELLSSSQFILGVFILKERGRFYKNRLSAVRAVLKLCFRTFRETEQSRTELSFSQQGTHSKLLSVDSVTNQNLNICQIQLLIGLNVRHPEDFTH